MPRNRKFLRRTLILTASVALLAATSGGLYFWRMRQIGRRFREYRDEGIAAARAGDNARAADLLHRYLIRYPDDVGTLSAYSRVLPQVERPDGSQISETVLVLRHLLQLDPRRVEDRRYLLSLYVQTRYATEALQTADSLLGSDARRFGPADVATLSAKTNALIWLNRFDAALASARQWNAADPADASAGLTLLYLLQRNQKPAQDVLDEASALCTRMRAALPRAGADSLRPEMIEAYAQELTDHRDKAIEMLRKSAVHAPATAEEALLLVNRLEAMGLADESLAVLEKAPGGDSDPALRGRRTRRLWEQGRSQEVVRATQGLNPADRHTDADLLGMRALCLQRGPGKDEASSIAKALAARSDDPVAAAWASIVEQPADVAGAKQVARACQAALDRDPSDAYLRFYFGEACERLGESDLAVSAWRRAAGDDPAWAAPLVRAADVLSDAGRAGPAVQAAVEANRRAPHDAAAAVAVARAWAVSLADDTAQKSPDLLAFATSIQEQLKGEPQTLAIRVALLAHSGRVAEARDVLRHAVEGGDPVEESSLLRLASLSRYYHLGLEQKCLDRSERDYGVTPALCYARAGAELAAGRAADGLRVIDTGNAASKNRDSVDWRVVRATYLLDANDPAARSAVTELSDRYPADVRVQLFAIDAPAVQADRDLRNRIVQRLRDACGEQGLKWRVERARWLMDFPAGDADFSSAAALLTEVVRQAPDVIEPRMLLARCAELRHKPADAIEQLSVAASLQPDAPGILLELAAQRQKAGDFDRAAAHLDQVSASTALTAGQRRQAAELYARQGMWPAARDLLEKARRTGPLSRGDCLFLAQLHAQTGDVREALALCDELVKTPDLATLEFAARLYASAGRGGDADRALDAMDRTPAAPGERELARADFVAQHGLADRALDGYRAATAAAPTNSVAWRSLIAYCLASGRASDASDAVKRAVGALPADPAVLAISARWPGIQQADRYPRTQNLVIEFLRDPVNSSASADAAELLLDAARNARPLDQCLPRLTELADRNPSLLAVQLAVAEIDAGCGRRDEAVEVATRAARNNPTSADPWRVAARVLAVSGRWAEVVPAAEAWRERSADDPVPADLALAEARLHLGKPGDALRQLQPYADRAAQSPADRARYERVLPTYAAAAQESGAESAQTLMEPLLSRGPLGRSAWMTFALDHLPPDQAAGWLRRVDPLIPPNEPAERILLAQVWDTLSSRTHRPEFAAASRQVLTPMAARSDAPPAVLIAMGIRNEEDGNLPAAQTFYRRALSLPGDESIARNNLAMVLASTGGDLREAQSLVDDAIKAHPDVALFYDTLARVREKLNDFTGAAAAMDVAARMDPENLNYRVHLAEVNVSARRLDGAASALREVDARAGDPDRLSDPLRRRVAAVRRALAQAGRPAAVNPVSN